MSRVERRKVASKKSNQGKIILTALVSLSVLLAVAFLVKIYLSVSVVPLDEKTLCPLAGPSSVNVILVDISDPLPETSRVEADLLLTEIATAIPKFGLLDIRQLSSQSPFQRSLFARCNPGDGSDLSRANANPTLARKKWQESFMSPARASILQSLTPSQTETSPIMAAIQRIAIERFLPSNFDGTPKNLVVVSDLFESTAMYSQYSRNFDFEAFKKSPAFKSYQTDLRGASVTFFYVQRKAQYDDRSHIHFWESWVGSNHGQLELVKKLQGVGK